MSPDVDQSLSTYISKYAVCVLMMVIILISVLGNLLVCIAIYTERRLRKLGNLFLASLALADLFVGLLVMSFSLANRILGRWTLGATFCRLWISFDVMCCTSSILHLCAICTDRFLHIKDPYAYAQYMHRRLVLLVILLIWLLSALISFLPLSLGWHQLGLEALVPLQPLPVQLNFSANGINGHAHGIAWQNLKMETLEEQLRRQEEQCNLEFSPLYAVVSSCISFYLPCLIMVALYTRLYLYARKHVKNIKRTMCKPPPLPPQLPATPIQPNVPTLQYNNLPDTNQTTKASLRPSVNTNVLPASSQPIVDHKAAITIGVIMGSFLLCWVPFFLMNIVLSVCKDCVSDIVFNLLTWLGWLNSALNPIIYSIFNSEFRQAFHRILTGNHFSRCARWRTPTRATVCTLLPNQLKNAQARSSFACGPASEPPPPSAKLTNALSSEPLANGSRLSVNEPRIVHSHSQPSIPAQLVSGEFENAQPV